MTTVVVLLFIALASVGIGYGLWSKTLYIDGTVNTGEFDSGFIGPFTDDDNSLHPSGKDPGDTGSCPAYEYGDPGSCDPDGFGPEAPRKDKDVGECIVTKPDAHTLVVTVSNAYPSYYCSVFFHVKNTGDIPVKIQSLGIVGPDITAGYIKAHWTDQMYVGRQIDPGEEVQGDLDLHVEQSAPENGNLELTGKIQLVQWNEFADLVWQTCSPGPVPCQQAPEVSFDGNTVIMGELGEGGSPNTQVSSVHGGSALLPEGSSYDVTFQYHVCSWDYNGWDVFSVSTSDKPYWAPGATLDFAWKWNGSSSQLQCTDGKLTMPLMGYPGGTYLNAVLDTGTPPSNHALPSFGTITIEKIVVHP
jgi:hypothetical protein